MGSRSWQFGDFLLFPERQELFVAGMAVEITPKARALLVLLIEHRHKVLTFDEMLRRVCGTTARSRSLVAQMIKQIRTALADESGSPRWIRSYHGVGYRFVGAVVELNGHEAQALQTRPWSDRTHGLEWGEPGCLPAPARSPPGSVLAVFEQGLAACEFRDDVVVQQSLAQLLQLGGRQPSTAAGLCGATLRTLRALRAGDHQASLRLLVETRLSLASSAPASARADFYLVAAAVEMGVQSFKDAMLSLEVAWALASAHRLARGLATCARLLGVLLARLGLFEPASLWLQRACDLSSQAGYPAIEGAAESSLISIRIAKQVEIDRMEKARQTGAWTAIAEDVETAMAKCAPMRLPPDLKSSLGTLYGIALAKTDRAALAFEVLEREVAAFLAHNNLDGVASTSYYLAEACMQAGNAKAAIDVCLRGIAACEQRQLFPHGYRNLLIAAEEALVALGDIHAAAAYRHRLKESRIELSEAWARDEAHALMARLPENGRRGLNGLAMRGSAAGPGGS
jgi:DNA-binding winged helix-turn-helix (wHTH) protein